MYTKMTRIIALLCAVVFCLVGCQQQPAEDSSITESQLWENMPVLTYGQMEYEKLKVEPWYCGRTEATGVEKWIETKDGLYHFLRWDGQLLYADRANILNWFPVCSKPQCTHPKHTAQCNAYLSGNTFAVHNGRIYYSADLARYTHLYRAKGNGRGLFSKAMDGTDVQLGYVIENALITDGGQVSDRLMPNGWVYNSVILNPDGTSKATCYWLSDSGLHVLFEKTYDDIEIAQTSHVINVSPFGGDGSQMFTNTLMGTGIYTVENNMLKEIPALADYRTFGGYLSGNTLRQFRSNEGYYDINLETGEEMRLADAKLKNSQSFIVLPNCIIETTLGSENHQEGDQHSMMLFDGESWRTVALPEELTQIYTLDMPFEMGVVTSDRIIILVYTSQRYSRCNMYQIMLGEDELTMEFCAELK